MYKAHYVNASALGMSSSVRCQRQDAETPSLICLRGLLQEEPREWVQQAGPAAAVTSRAAVKRKAEQLEEAEAEALLDERARAWNQAHHVGVPGQG